MNIQESLHVLGISERVHPVDAMFVAARLIRECKHDTELIEVRHIIESLVEFLRHRGAIAPGAADLYLLNQIESFGLLGSAAKQYDITESLVTFLAASLTADAQTLKAAQAQARAQDAKARQALLVEQLEEMIAVRNAKIRTWFDNHRFWRK